MGKILAVTTHATDNQTKSTAAFLTAIGALGAGKEVGIALIGEAVYLAKKEIAKSVHGVGFPPLPELIDQVVEGDVPVYVWGACSVARGVTEDDLKTLNASFIDPIKFANLVAESNVVSFWWSSSSYKMAQISEVAKRIYEIKPEGKEHESFPLCTVYLVMDDKPALVETGFSVQIPDILEAVDKLGFDIRKLSYIIPTHVHPDHAGAAGLLARQLPETKVVVYSRAAKVLADPSILERLMQGFKQVFGDGAQERFGEMLPIAEDRFVLVQDGESISLGERELRVIHSPGHDPNHLCFLDTKSKGLFCGDALGAYFSEIKGRVPSCILGSDPILILQSIDKLRELKPAILFFSHGGAIREVAEIIQRAANDEQQCADIALKALKDGESREELANSLADVVAKDSTLTKEDYLASSPYFISLMTGGYRQYFKKKNMI